MKMLRDGKIEGEANDWVNGAKGRIMNLTAQVLGGMPNSKWSTLRACGFVQACIGAARHIL